MFQVIRMDPFGTGWQQLIVLLFAQAGRKDSLRDIETSLSVHHCGHKGQEMWDF